jgi:hypothetical protein
MWRRIHPEADQTTDQAARAIGAQRPTVERMEVGRSPPRRNQTEPLPGLNKASPRTGSHDRGAGTR